MSPGRKQFAGGAAETTLNGGISSGATAMTLVNAASYPSGSVGPFVCVIGVGLATEEKVLCSVTAGANITITTRGYDGTVASAHSSGEIVRHVLDADTVNEANDHVNTVTRDDHTQYLKVDGTRVPTGVTAIAAVPGASAVGDVAAKGAGPTLATSNHVHGREGFGTPVTVGTALAAGSATTVAHSDHVHTAPLGRVAYASTGSSQSVTNSGADVDLTTLTVTFTFVNGRAYRISGSNYVAVPNSTSCTMKLKQGSTEVATDTFANQVASGGSFGDNLYVSYINAALSGSITFKLTAQVNGGAATTTTFADTSYIMVEDIGM